MNRRLVPATALFSWHAFQRNSARAFPRAREAEIQARLVSRLSGSGRRSPAMCCRSSTDSSFTSSSEKTALGKCLAPVIAAARHSNRGARFPLQALHERAENLI